MTCIPERRRAADVGEGLELETYGRMIDQIACPAYCCTPAGAVLHCNRSARRLWGACPSPAENGSWHGFAALYDADGNPVEKSDSPAALAMRTGVAPPPTELVGASDQGRMRCVVIHARLIYQADGAIAGVLCSMTDISERHRLRHEIEFFRDNRDEFLHMLAHELRNPLASVMAVAGILRRQPGESMIVPMARVIERQTRQLARFIDDLLDASRMEHACDIPVDMRAAGVGDVLARARDVVDGVLRERGQTLHVELDVDGAAPAAVLWCDSERLGQALGNVLLNASGFSDDGADISLAVAVEGGILELLVCDEGIGVEASDLPLMFEPFRKFAAHPRRAPSGAGLGLAIARGVCMAHGGMVTAHSAGRGQGTCLKFTLPVVHGAASA